MSKVSYLFRRRLNGNCENMATLAKATHYVATDWPQVTKRSHLRHLVSVDNVHSDMGVYGVRLQCQF